MLIQQLQATLVSLQEENASLKLRNDARASEPAASFAHTGSSSMSAGSEIAALLADVRQLRTSNELIQRSHDALLRENEQAISSACDNYCSSACTTLIHSFPFRLG